MHSRAIAPRAQLDSARSCWLRSKRRLLADRCSATDPAACHDRRHIDAHPFRAEGRLQARRRPAGGDRASWSTGSQSGLAHQTLLGVTGSGKTFTIANVIQQVQRPTLVLAHNKTLAAQLYGEFKEFFPDNAVEYFVSYYDYYQPEAYVPSSDTYIEKDSSINEHIEQMRLSATKALLERPRCDHRRDRVGDLRPRRSAGVSVRWCCTCRAAIASISARCCAGSRTCSTSATSWI